jgi:hypothetical protein
MGVKVLKLKKLRQFMLYINISPFKKDYFCYCAIVWICILYAKDSPKKSETTKWTRILFGANFWILPHFFVKSVAKKNGSPPCWRWYAISSKVGSLFFGPNFLIGILVFRPLNACC